MAIDHFEEHFMKDNRTNWNFNVLFDTQPQVAEMAAKYKPLLTSPYLYDPIPAPWLHSTVLFAGLLEDFTEAEMLTVAELLEPRLQALAMPELTFDSWWIMLGNPVLHISPDDKYRQLFALVITTLKEVVGSIRIAHLPTHFTAHMTLAYSKTHNHESDYHQKLVDQPITPARFRAKKLSLIKQQPINGHYEWEVIKELAIGQH